jgi:CHASE1-domain containing sensor protein
VEFINIKKYYPGMGLFAYAKVVPGGEKDEFIQAVRSSGLTNFKIWPEGNRDKYIVAFYSEPFNERSKKAIGYDMLTDEVRKVALEKAVLVGDITLTNSLTLVYDKDLSSSTVGFLAFVPVYRGGGVPQSIMKRIQLIDGFVSAPLHINDIVGGILDPSKSGLVIKIYDGLSVLPKSLIYSSANNVGEKNILYRRVQTVYVANHPWTIEFFGVSDKQQNFSDRYLPNIIFLFGTIFSILLYIIFYIGSSAKTRAMNTARKLTADLEENRKKLEEKNMILEEKVDELNFINKAMVDRELKMIELKRKINKK